MKQIKKIINNHDKPSNPKIVKLLAVASLLVVFIPVWFSSIPFNVSQVVKDLVTWIISGVDITLACVAVFGGYKYKGRNFKSDDE